MQIRVRNMNKVLNKILIINYCIVFYLFIYSAKKLLFLTNYTSKFL